MKSETKPQAFYLTPISTPTLEFGALTLNCRSAPPPSFHRLGRLPVFFIFRQEEAAKSTLPNAAATVTMHFRTAFSILAACFIASAALGQVSKVGNRYLFRVKYTKGEVLNYKMIASDPGMNADVTMPIKVRVSSVSHGVADVFYSTSVAVNGHVGPSQEQEVLVDSLGQALDGSTTTLITFPAKPIRIGDSWSAALPGSQMLDGVRGKFTFAGLRLVGGVNEAIVNIKLNFTGAMHGSGEGRAQIDAADGQVRLMVFNVLMTAKIPAMQGQPSRTSSIRATTTMKRV